MINRKKIPSISKRKKYNKKPNVYNANDSREHYATFPKQTNDEIIFIHFLFLEMQYNYTLINPDTRVMRKIRKNPSQRHSSHQTIATFKKF